MIFRPVLHTLSVLAILVLLGLGTWQVQRLQWKEALIAKAEARVAAEPVSVATALQLSQAGEDIEYLPVRAVGGFARTDVAHVFGTYEGQAGAYVFQAMELDEPADRVLLINRGFVPQDDWAETYELPNAQAFTGLIRLYEGPGGIAEAVAPKGREGELLFTRDVDVLAKTLAPGREENVLPFAIDSTLPTDLPQGNTTRLDFRNAHLGYAITWYGLAAGLLAVTVAMSRKRQH